MANRLNLRLILGGKVDSSVEIEKKDNSFEDEARAMSADPVSDTFIFKPSPPKL